LAGHRVLNTCAFGDSGNGNGFNVSVLTLTAIGNAPTGTVSVHGLVPCLPLVRFAIMADEKCRLDAGEFEDAAQICSDDSVD
jgi:hypothetical protein